MILYSVGSRFLPGVAFAIKQDFRNFIGVFYKGLGQLCSLAQQSAGRSIMSLKASSMLAKEIITRRQFDDDITMALSRFQQRTPVEFTRTLNLIRTNIQGNALIAVFSTNWQFAITEKSQGRNASFRGVPNIYADTQQNTSCSCATLQTCTMSAQFFVYNGTMYHTIEGLRLGCYSLETILQSSLSCFYSVTCIYQFREALKIPTRNMLLYKNATNGTIQFNSTNTRFNINDTIETLTSELFIESWTTNVSYERFFNSCAPSYCTSREYYRFDTLELLTTFLSVYVGLSLGSKFLAPLLVKMAKKIRNRFRVVPIQ